MDEYLKINDDIDDFNQIMLGHKVQVNSENKKKEIDIIITDTNDLLDSDGEEPKTRAIGIQ